MKEIKDLMKAARLAAVDTMSLNAFAVGDSGSLNDH